MISRYFPGWKVLGEILVIFLVAWWAFHNPAEAGHFIGAIIHFFTVKLPGALTVLVQSI